MAVSPSGGKTKTVGSGGKTKTKKVVLAGKNGNPESARKRKKKVKKASAKGV